MKTQASVTAILLALLCVYVVWGSTYLAILFAIETMPPFLMAGARFLLAGGLLYAWCRWRGAEKPKREHWVSATVIGTALLLGGNGAVVWAELRISSGLAALLVSTVPLWLVVLDWARPGGVRPTRRILLGLVLGFFGVALLIGPTGLSEGEIDRLGCIAVLFGSLCWAWGSLKSRTASQPSSALMTTALRMIGGGATLTLTGLLLGETATLDLGAVSARSWIALAYLVVFGSILAFTCYLWLLTVTSPANVGTYAYVNPVVAVFLGWALANEAVTARILWAAAVILVAVAMISIPKRKPKPTVDLGPPVTSPTPSK